MVKNKSEIKIFKAKQTNKTYPHYKKHKANARQVAWDIFEKNKNNLKKGKKDIFETAYNMGYKEAWNREQFIISDKCLTCKIKLGFRGFCSKDCHKKYFRKPEGHKDKKSKEFHKRKNKK